MRLKQLLGILLSLLVLSSMAAAAGTHLTAVQARPQGAGTTITIQASGAFTHTEYRPADDSLLVDLAGVSTGTVEARLHAVNLPGVQSYEVTSFKGASGAEVTRIEFHLQGTPSVSLADGTNAVTVNVTAPAAAAQPSVAETAPDAPPAAPAAPAASSKPVAIEHIGVVHGADGTAVEISGNGLMTGKVMRLTGPDRLVLDLPNTVLATRSRHILVGAADLKDVRVGRFHLSPPVTRIVLDLNAQRDWELTPAGNKLVLKMRPAAMAAAAAAPVPASAAAPAPQAQDFVMVEPAYQPKTENTETAAAQPPADPVARATDAASKFTAETTAADVPLVAHVVPPSNAAMAPDAQAAMPAVNPAAQPQQQAAPAAKRYTGEPISLNLKDADLVDFFRLIHEISGLNVVLDPNVKGRITLVLDDVPWDQALDIVLKNNGLDMQLEGNVLRIATVDTMRREAEARRAQAEAQALAANKITITRFLSYAKAKDVAPTIKKLLSQRGDVFSDDRTNALIIQDIPAVFPAIDRLLTQLDRKTQEVEIEARVVAATRNFARDIGTQLGFGWGNGVNTMIGGAATGNTPTQVQFTCSTPGCTPPSPQYYTVGTGQIPFFSNFGATSPTSGIGLVNATRTYRLDYYLTMAESRGLLKILSRPRVVTQNNIQALVKQGLRIPIVTAAQLGGPSTTTYVDAFLRLTVTPQITAENTIFLNVDVENTVPDFGHVNNLGNPTLITQQATTQVLVTDGGTVVIGGVIQTQNSVSVFQVPLLGSIPVLGNLFKRRSVTSQTQELIFFITPKIIQT
jgi:type IV pilus assembly protein PilQ